MEFVASIIALALTAALVLLLNYYRRLLNDGRREYPREELIHAHNFIINEWQRLISADPRPESAHGCLSCCRRG